MCPSGGRNRGGPGGHGASRRRAEAHRVTGIRGFQGTGFTARVAEEEPDGSGQGFWTRRKGAASAAPSPTMRTKVKTQSSSQETEALSAAGAVRLRSARIPREATVWTVDIRMARSRLTDQFST